MFIRGAGRERVWGGKRWERKTVSARRIWRVAAGGNVNWLDPAGRKARASGEKASGERGKLCENGAPLVFVCARARVQPRRAQTAHHRMARTAHSM